MLEQLRKQAPALGRPVELVLVHGPGELDAAEIEATVADLGFASAGIAVRTVAAPGARYYELKNAGADAMRGRAGASSRTTSPSARACWTPTGVPADRSCAIRTSRSSTRCAGRASPSGRRRPRGSSIRIPTEGNSCGRACPTATTRRCGLPAARARRRALRAGDARRARDTQRDARRRQSQRRRAVAAELPVALAVGAGYALVSVAGFLMCLLDPGLVPRRFAL
jgi:hypothetical protein